MRYGRVAGRAVEFWSGFAEELRVRRVGEWLESTGPSRTLIRFLSNVKQFTACRSAACWNNATKRLELYDTMAKEGTP